MTDNTTNTQMTLKVPKPIELPKFKVLSKISGLKCPVFLVETTSNNTKYVCKIFKYQDEQYISNNFLNELQFAQIKHPNIVVPQFWEYKRQFSAENGTFGASVLLSPYIPNGDFHDLISQVKP
mmetsp:Transcript_37699/g.33714  ORF Transcript_37699/g.33714 Transcript_37699/m.33714 type:complete len:123 (+) Transcript_37699:144-512(+)